MLKTTAAAANSRKRTAEKEVPPFNRRACGLPIFFLPRFVHVLSM
ncbi:MAG TPA: hypothetical protein VN366_11610 [Feifaniaceae bacterium]|nr:hypothetical protein [Feifaniaceae bacterium]